MKCPVMVTLTLTLTLTSVLRTAVEHLRGWETATGPVRRVIRVAVHFNRGRHGRGNDDRDVNKGDGHKHQ